MLTTSTLLTSYLWVLKEVSHTNQTNQLDELAPPPPAAPHVLLAQGLEGTDKSNVVLGGVQFENHIDHLTSGARIQSIGPDDSTDLNRTALTVHDKLYGDLVLPEHPITVWFTPDYLTIHGGLNNVYCNYDIVTNRKTGYEQLRTPSCSMTHLIGPTKLLEIDDLAASIFQGSSDFLVDLAGSAFAVHPNHPAKGIRGIHNKLLEFEHLGGVGVEASSGIGIGDNIPKSEVENEDKRRLMGEENGLGFGSVEGLQYPPFPFQPHFVPPQMSQMRPSYPQMSQNQMSQMSQNQPPTPQLPTDPAKLMELMISKIDDNLTKVGRNEIPPNPTLAEKAFSWKLPRAQYQAALDKAKAEFASQHPTHGYYDHNGHWQMVYPNDLSVTQEAPAMPETQRHTAPRTDHRIRPNNYGQPLLYVSNDNGSYVFEGHATDTLGLVEGEHIEEMIYETNSRPIHDSNYLVRGIKEMGWVPSEWAAYHDSLVTRARELQRVPLSDGDVPHRGLYGTSQRVYFQVATITANPVTPETPITVQRVEKQIQFSLSGELMSPIFAPLPFLPPLRLLLKDIKHWSPLPNCAYVISVRDYQEMAQRHNMPPILVLENVEEINCNRQM